MPSRIIITLQRRLPSENTAMVEQQLQAAGFEPDKEQRLRSLCMLTGALAHDDLASIIAMPGVEHAEVDKAVHRGP
jgi:hypothetical protein